jgi:hypothetical protein
MRAFAVLCLLSAPARADYQLTLAGATAVSPSGDAIQLSGGGTFDADGQDVRISGSYVVVDANGVQVRRGTWHVHQLGKFVPWRGRHELGGLLEVMATLVSEAGAIDQQRMRFVCTSNKPATIGEDEGVSVGNFLEHASGMVTFRKR